MSGLPRFIPIVTPDSIDIFNSLSDVFKYAIIPYYTVVSGGRPYPRLSRRTKWILSSIMPDELLLNSDIHRYYLEVAEKLRVDYILVWDMPTYLNNWDESLQNTYASLDRIRFFMNRGFEIIPLIKGAFEEHIRLSASEIWNMGFETAAFHVSEYLYSDERPWPYIKDFSLTAEELMIRYVEAILEYDFKQLLLVGGGSPRHASTLLNLDDRICVAGYSWYLDAVYGNIYMPTGLIERLDRRYIECSCRNCRGLPPRLLRSHTYIAGHNLILNKLLIDDEVYDIEIELLDLIADYHEDILIIGEVSVGAEKSIWRQLITYLNKVRPDHLIIIGEIFDLRSVDKRRISQWTEFLGELRRLQTYYGTTIHPVNNYPSTTLPHILKDLLFPVDQHPRETIFGEASIDNIAIAMARIITASKSPLKIKKRIAPGKQLTLSIHFHGTAEKDIEQAINEMRNFRRSGEWLISDYINQPYIDPINKIATPGSWNLANKHYNQSKPGAIHITRDGEIKLETLGE